MQRRVSLQAETSMAGVLLIFLFVALIFAPRAAWPQGGMPVGPEFPVNTFTTNDQDRPSVAADSAGDFVVVWQSPLQDGAGNGVFGQRYAASGAPLGPEFRVNTYTTDFQSLPSVATDSAANFVVVWTSLGQDGSGEGVFGQRYASSGTLAGPEFRVNTYTTNYQSFPSVSADSSGNFVVVWQSFGQDGPDNGVFGQRYASIGVPIGTEFRVNTYTTNNQYLTAVASDAAGNFVVAWESRTQDGSGRGVFGQRYAGSGTPLGPEFRVNTYTTSDQRLLSVAADTSGNFVIVWDSATQDGSGEGVFGQRYAASGALLGPEFRVNSYTTGFQGYPAVAVDSSSNFVVVWYSYQDGSGFGVFGQRYASSGSPVGPEFRVNTYTTGGQNHPSVAADTSGNFVVVWESNQDASGYGVFGQRYSQIVPVELMHFRVE